MRRVVTGGSRIKTDREAQAVRWGDDPHARPQYVFTTADGAQWVVYTHWAVLDGNLTAVGVDLRSFRQDPSGERHPLPTGLQAVTAALWRSVRIAEVIEGTRKHLMEVTAKVKPSGAIVGMCPVHGPRIPERAARRLTQARAALTEKPRPRRGRPFDPGRGPKFHQLVADLYLDIKRSGGECTNRPRECLRTELGKLDVRGVDGSPEPSAAQVDAWIKRAQAAGFLPARS